MIPPEIQRSIEVQQKALVVIWVAFILCLIIYLLIPEIVFPGVWPPAGDLFSDSIRGVLWVVAFMAVGLLSWWRRRYLDRGSLLKRLQTDPIGLVFSYYLGRKIVAFALAESVALLGFVLAIVGRYLWDQYLLSVVSAALLIVEFPSRVFLEELMKETLSKGGS